jgi:hypothetical protein
VNVTGIVILLVLVVLVAVAVAMITAAKRRKRSEQLQGRFGPEYDRAVDQHGNRKAAESRLSEVAQRRDALELRDLSAGDRASFGDRWSLVQTVFVDDPAGAVRDADHLVAEVMGKRGYPVENFETKVDMVAADHPEVVEHYRAAHAIAAQQDATTEDQRQAFVHYRILFAELLHDGEHGRHADSDDIDLTARDRSTTTPGQD